MRKLGSLGKLLESPPLISEPQEHQYGEVLCGYMHEVAQGEETVPVIKVRMLSRERERQRQATVHVRSPNAASASAAAMAERRTKR